MREIDAQIEADERVLAAYQERLENPRPDDGDNTGFRRKKTGVWSCIYLCNVTVMPSLIYVYRST